MKFDDWWDSLRSASKERHDVARKAWNAATKAEREACAKLAEDRTVLLSQLSARLDSVEGRTLFDRALLRELRAELRKLLASQVVEPEG